MITVSPLVMTAALETPVSSLLIVTDSQIISFLSIKEIAIRSEHTEPRVAKINTGFHVAACFYNFHYTPHD